MEEKIKEIIAVFTKIPADKIEPSTPLDRSVLKNSILLHRMYAKLAEEGAIISNYQHIKNFGELLRSANINSRKDPASAQTSSLALAPGDTAAETSIAAHSSSVLLSIQPQIHPFDPGSDQEADSVGIDMEEIAALPRVTDFRKDEFYKMNFSPSEISYCVLQPDPYASFTGLFAAKEAIVKASKHYHNLEFSKILIDHSVEGRPVHPEFNLSISHAGGMAVAIAAPRPGHFTLSEENAAPRLASPTRPPSATGRIALIGWVALLSLLISIIALAIIIIR